MPRRLLGVPLVVMSLAACANVVGDDSPEETGGLALEGSYELAFTSATATIEHYTRPATPEAAPPSIGNRARLDLRRTPAGGFEAVFTARWGTPAAYTVTVHDDALTLNGGGTIATGHLYASRTDTWKTITLVRNKAGLLTGEVRASGYEDVMEGDVGWHGALTGEARLTADALAPELEPAPASRIGPVDRLLPWETLVVTTAEPLAQKDVIDATRVAMPGKNLPLTWLPTADETWAGATRFEARFDDWPSAMSGTSWQISQAAGVRDRVGNGAVAASAPVSFLALPVTRAVDFDTDSLEAAFWGGDVLGGGIAGTDDPRCESGGCLRLGPASFTGCSAPRAGVATQLTRGTTNRVAVRFRVLAASPYGDAAPMLYGPLLTVQLAQPGGAVSTKDIDAASAKVTFTKLSTPIDGLTWASAWTTIHVDAPAGTSPLGVAVAVGHRQYACGGPPLPPSNTAFLFESIAAE